MYAGSSRVFSLCTQDTGGYAWFATLYFGGREGELRSLEVLEVPEVPEVPNATRDALLCILEAVNDEPYLLDLLEAVHVCYCVLEAVENQLCLLEAVKCELGFEVSRFLLWQFPCRVCHGLLRVQSQSL